VTTPLAALHPDVLRGRFVHLEPLSRDHVAELAAAAADRSTFTYTRVPDDETSMLAYVDELLAQADLARVVPFAQRRVADGRLVGCTRFMELMWWSGRHEPDEVEIGGTWLAADAQRSPVNTEAKLLLLTHAFDTWGVARVALCTDARNTRSRAAIERVGASFEGILRHHRASYVAGEEGTARDSAMFSIIRSEWPGVRQQLTQRLERNDG
jgi:N-acetyltransferase